MTAFTLTSLDSPGSPATLATREPLPGELQRRISEDVSLWPQPWRWWQDGYASPYGGFAFSRGATGTTTDRRGGKNLPLFWSELDLRGFRILARFLRQTNPFAIGFAEHLIGYHVRKGFGWQACLKGRKKTAYPTVDSEPDPAVAKGQQILDAWRDATLWPLKSREAFDRWITDGEVFGRLGRGDWGKLPWFRFVGPEQVGSPTGDTEGPESFGIETPEGDQQGPPVRFHLWNPDSGMTEGHWVDADRIIHAKRNVTSDVKRGLPDFFPLHEWLDGTRKLLWNMIDTAGEQAKIAWREKFPTATQSQVQSLIPMVATTPGSTTALSAWSPYGYPPNLDLNIPVGPNLFKPSKVVRVEGSREYEAGPTFAGAASYIEVEQAALRGCGARWGMPEYFSGDASNNNFASSLVAGSPFAVAVEGGQLAFGSCWERPIALKVLELARDAGLLTYDEWRRLDVEVTPPAVVTPKPLEDTQQRQILNAAHILSPQTWQLMEQLDPQHEAANWQAFTTQGGADLGGPMDPLAGMQGGGGGLPTEPSFEAFLRYEDKTVGLVKKQITDKDGVQRTVYVRPDEKPAAAGGGKAADDAPAKSAGARALDRVKAIGSAALNTRVGRFFKAVEHKLMILQHKTRDIAMAAAKNKPPPPLTAEQTDRLSRTLFIADFIGGYITGAAGAVIGGAVGAKIGAILPSASVLYVAYATVRDPAGVWAAARAVVKATIRGGSTHEGKIPGLAEMLAELLSGPDADWKESVFLAALAEGATPERALEVADGAGDMPEELPQATPEDFGETDSAAESVCGPSGEPLSPDSVRVLEAAGLVPKDVEVHRGGKVFRQRRMVRPDEPVAGLAPAKSEKPAKPSKPARVPEKKPSEKALRAKAAHKLVDKTIQRYAEEHNEPAFAKDIGGLSFKDNEPVDVVLGDGGIVKHGIELKTMVDNGNNKITMKRSAMERKAQWEKDNKATFHTVVIDDSAVFNANGEGKHDVSKRRLFYRRGYGSFRVGSMHEVKNLAELKKLLDTANNQLPPAAQRK